MIETVHGPRLFVRQRLTVVTTGHTRSDLGHLHQTVPQPLAVDPKVFTQICHVDPPAAESGGFLTIW